MKKSLVPCLLALSCAACLTLPACQSDGKKSKPREDSRMIDRQGVKAIGVLAHYLFPPQWDEAMQVSMARRMFPLEYHGSENRGRPKIQSKVEFDGGALQRLLGDVQKTTPSFTTSVDAQEPFGKDSEMAEIAGGAVIPLAWWKPGKHKNPAFFSWVTEHTGEVPARVWLQVTDDKKNVKTVYVRVEAE